MSRLVLVLNLIGWGSSGSLLDQSLNERNQNQSNSELLSTLNSKLLNKWEFIVQPRQGGQRHCKHLFLPLIPLALDILEIISFFCKIENCEQLAGSYSCKLFWRGILLNLLSHFYWPFWQSFQKIVLELFQSLFLYISLDFLRSVLFVTLCELVKKYPWRF